MYGGAHMAKSVSLNILLPKNRDHSGWLRVEVDGVTSAEMRVLGRGSATVGGKPTGNPTRNPFVKDGDTPTGQYVAEGIRSTGDRDQRSYGPWGAVVLNAVSGPARLAQAMGRTGLLIHGGAPGRFDGLRPTLGCLRLANEDMKRLTDAIFAAGQQSVSQRCEAIAVRVNVREF